MHFELCRNPWISGQACLTKMKLQKHSCKFQPPFFQKLWTNSLLGPEQAVYRVCGLSVLSCYKAHDRARSKSLY